MPKNRGKLLSNRNLDAVGSASGARAAGAESAGGCGSGGQRVPKALKGVIVGGKDSLNSELLGFEPTQRARKVVLQISDPQFSLGVVINAVGQQGLKSLGLLFGEGNDVLPGDGGHDWLLWFVCLSLTSQ